MACDVLSDVLRTVRLTGAFFYEVRAGRPWVAAAPDGSWIAPRLLPGAQHLIAYHVVTHGRCWTAVTGDAAAVELTQGSIALYAHGTPHVMASAPDLRAPPVLESYRQPGPDETLPYFVDERAGGEETVRVLCGFLGCDAQPFNPLVQALPPLVHVANAYGTGQGGLAALIEAAVTESSAGRIGASTVLSRLSELMFIEVVRRYMESLPIASAGWLGALVDPCAGRALRLLHADPARPWTLQMLAREAGFSRTVLTERFTRQVGCPPIAYLLKWRMQIAASLLADGVQGTARVAERVGYGSEEAFSRAFKRCTGDTPAEWRRRLAGREEAAFPFMESEGFASRGGTS